MQMSVAQRTDIIELWFVGPCLAGPWVFGVAHTTLGTSTHTPPCGVVGRSGVFCGDPSTTTSFELKGESERNKETMR